MIAAPLTKTFLSPNLGSVKGRGDKSHAAHAMLVKTRSAFSPNMIHQCWPVKPATLGRGEFEGGLGWVGMLSMHDRPRGIRLRSVSQENMDTGDTISYSDLAKSGDLDLDRKR